MAGFRSLSSGLRALRPGAFGADPRGERMARIRRSPHFKDGVFQNPGGTARTRPSGSTAGLREGLLRQGDPAPPHPEGHGAGACHHPRRPRPAPGHRAAADLDGALQRARGDRRPAGPVRPGVGRSLLAVRLRRAQAAAPGAPAAGRARPGRRGGHLARPLRPPGHAHHQGAGRHGHAVRRPARRRRAPGALGRVRRPAARAGLARDHEDRRPHPDRHPGPALLRTRSAQHPAHPVGLLGRRGSRSTGSTTAGTPATSTASRRSAPSTGRSTPR